ncbi:MAG: M3 family metallopeptidase, partial [Candidatus Dormibacteria bacterium]
EPFLTFSRRRDLRQTGWRMWVGRGEAGAHDNRPLIPEILALRREKARLLGFSSFAHWITDDQMAETPQRALDLMEAVWAPAKARAEEELARIEALAAVEAPGTRVEAWDWRYWAEKARRAAFDLDQEQVKPYLQLERLREAMFWVAGRLYGLEFALIDDLPVYEPSVRVWRVSRGADEVGLWYFDPYARSGKSSGAWMSEYRTQERFTGPITPIVSNNANFLKAAPGEPVLIAWDDAVTLFHEFGHALHGLNSDVAFPSLAGTHVARDFVEFPSQLNERWLPTPEVLTRFCRHCVTGEPMPAELATRLVAARTFNKGFETVEYLASALIDMKAHLAEGAVEPTLFE